VVAHCDGPGIALDLTQVIGMSCRSEGTNPEPADEPSGLPRWYWLTEKEVTDALLAQLRRLQAYAPYAHVLFVQPPGLMPGSELIAGIHVLRAAVDQPMVATGAPIG
jgi:hypothetical protein